MDLIPAQVIYMDCIFGVSTEEYIPTYIRTDVTNALHGSAGFRTDNQIVTKQKMRSIVLSTEKTEK